MLVEAITMTTARPKAATPGSPAVSRRGLIATSGTSSSTSSAGISSRGPTSRSCGSSA